MNHSKTNTFRIINIVYILLIILFVFFIFSNSIESKTISASKSEGIVDVINQTLVKMNIPLRITDFLVRKLAHFTEFFILGVLFFGYLTLNKKVRVKNSVYLSFISCLIAMTDETIQYFSQRGSMLLDVWLDFFASTFAIVLFYVLYTLVIKRKTKNK